MKAWQRFSQWIDALSLRERVILFLAASLMLAAMMYVLAFDAEFTKQKRLLSSINQKQSEAKAIEDQLIKLAASRAREPDRPERERLAQLRKQLAGTEAKIAAHERRLTSPQQVRNVLTELLARNRAVQLVNMKTLPPVAITAARAAGTEGASAAAKPPAEVPPLIYRHAIELTVSGGYLDLLAYLADLERLPVQLHWGSLEIDASNYPQHPMKLTVYTLSLDPAWLKV